jgi:hypothetical protein
MTATNLLGDENQVIKSVIDSTQRSTVDCVSTPRCIFSKKVQESLVTQINLLVCLSLFLISTNLIPVLDKSSVKL